MGAATVFDDTETPGGNLILNPVVKIDDTVGNVFLKSVAGKRVGSCLAGNNSGQVVLLEPAKEPLEF